MKNNLRFLSLLLAVLLSLILVSCGDPADDGSAPGDDTQTNEEENDTGDDTPVEGVSTTVTLNGTTATVDGEGAEFKDGILSITAEGVYELTGTLENGQVYVNVEKTEKVELVLKGVNIRSNTSAAIYAESSDKLSINLAEGTTNTLTDAVSYVYAVEGEDEPNACIFSKDDLTIKGSGSLVVVGQYNNGISSKNDIKIKDGNITVTSANTAIRGKDSVTVEGGNITVTAGNDALKSSTLEQGKGYILVTGGTLVLTAEDDGMQAENDVSVTGGSITVTAGGKTVNSRGTQSIASGTLTEK